MNSPDPVFPTFAEFKAILVRDFRCKVEGPPANLWSRKPVTFIVRRIGNDDVEAQFDLTDDERITRAIALYACRRLRILPAKLNFMSNPPVP